MKNNTQTFYKIEAVVVELRKRAQESQPVPVPFRNGYQDPVQTGGALEKSARAVALSESADLVEGLLK